MIRRFRSVSPVLAALFLLGAGAAEAVLFPDEADPAFHTSAPDGAYAGSGWQYQGRFGLVLGTAIAPSHFITATHADWFFSEFNYGGADYSILTRTSIPGTDLLVVKVNGVFDAWAPLFSGIAPPSSELVVMGLGGPKGAEIRDSDGVLQGWQTGSTDSVMRWGIDTVDSIGVIGGVGSMLVSSFDGGAGDVGFSAFDSGGGAFIYDDGLWKLAGITYGADTFALNSSGAGSFTPALFDPNGYYRKEEGVWTIQTHEDVGTRYYFSDISQSFAAITAIISVPEPSAGLIAVLALALGLRRRRDTAVLGGAV